MTDRLAPGVAFGLLLLTATSDGLFAQVRRATPHIRQTASLAGQFVNGLGEESPDGRFLLYSVRDPEVGYPGELRIYDSRTGGTHSLGVAGVEGVWSPGGDRVAYTGPAIDGSGLHIWTIPVDPGTARPRAPARRVSLHMGRGASWSPDGTTLAFTAMPPTDTVAPRIILVPATGGRERVLVRATGWAHQIFWAPDGRSVYYRYAAIDGRLPRELVRAPLDGAPPEKRRDIHDFFGFTSDGRVLAYQAERNAFGGPREIRVGEISGPDLLHAPLPFAADSPRWRRDGRRMFAITWVDEHAVETLDLRTGTVEVLEGDGPDAGTAARWSPTGDRLAWIARDGERAVMMEMDDAPRRVSIPVDVGIRRVEWSPDGRRLAYLLDEGRELGVISAEGGAPLRLTGDRWIDDFRWRDDGRSIDYIARTEGDTVRVVRRVSLDGEDVPVRPLGADLGPPRVTRLVGDGLVLTWVGPRLVATPLDRGETRDVFTAGPAELLNNTFDLSPDGRLIAISTYRQHADYWERRLVLVPIDGGQPRNLEIPGVRSFGDLRWHPDGRHLVIVGSPDPSVGNRGVYIAPIDGGTPRLHSLRRPPPQTTVLQLSPDGSRVAFSHAAPAESILWELDFGPALELHAVDAGRSR
ncbi:MAG: hypothetical protein R3195_00560 [Gemmatimonadota bacterium]|nr:hypothetical protein [Gemmatimonadota bacterium]